MYKYLIIKKRCLVIKKESKKMTWCPKNSNDANFRFELDKEDWNKHFEDLKQLVGISDDNEYLKDTEQKKRIRNGNHLKAIWSDRYDEHKTCWLKLKVVHLKAKANSKIVSTATQVKEKRSKKQSQFDKRSVKRENMQEFHDDDDDDDNDDDDDKKEDDKKFDEKTQKEKVFDIVSMLTLVKKAEEEANQIKDKNVILLLGGTGTGKSTLVHFLAGSTMEQQEVDGRPHICPTKVKNKALANVRSSSSTKSETRYITAVPIDLKEMGVYGDQDTVVLCDTPGFEDTSGPEVDVANGIGIIKALQNCKSVKPVVLITYTALGYRMNYIRELARTLVGIIPSIKDHLNTFSKNNFSMLW
ncbi:hypothetical protein RFI_11973 [Reticulomyxa filosa]|uniref:G domain-containing protein n=1 Tax=Reticulomyxa filosa TaxID=46433 RepID=X6NGZ3_RETFI|nr:hypothetical protein RFI_11973 [Reticulomyxa filosa]|eukprot:ETO25173.1 hypothetical protein RFI_11973 [Reticulomyxa filosa]